MDMSGFCIQASPRRSANGEENADGCSRPGPVALSEVALRKRKKRKKEEKGDALKGTHLFLPVKRTPEI
jgi:hypothetical protein